MPVDTIRVVGFAFNASVVLYSWMHLQAEKRRAALGDHVVETSRDIANPEHCVACGRPHPAMSLKVLPQFAQGAAFGKKRKTSYMFPFCAACAAPVLRRRRRATALKTTGWLLWGTLPLIVVAMLSGFKSLALLFLLLFSAVCGTFAMVAGAILDLRATMPAVTVLDPGGDTVLFHFGNQIFRNHFAELNGVGWKDEQVSS